MRTQFTLLLLVILNATTSATEPEPSEIQHVVAVEDVCAWPNLTLTGDGEILAILHNQPAHGTQEGDVECWASRDGHRAMAISMIGYAGAESSAGSGACG